MILLESMNVKKDNKLSRKPVDIESEFVGKPMAPAKKKPKKADLTDEFKDFMDKNPITLDDIKRIFIRTHGHQSEDFYQKSTIKVYAIEDLPQFNRYRKYLIIIKTPKIQLIYYSCYSEIRCLGWMRDELINDSFLRNSVFSKIRNWFAENQDQILVLV